MIGRALRRSLGPALATAVAMSAAPSAGQERLERAAHARLMEMVSSDASELAPFTTDGCSGGLSDVWAFVGEGLPVFADAHGSAPPWENCCVTHDRSYHAAGHAETAQASYAARLRADEALRSCVRETAHGREAALARQYGLSTEAVTTAYDLIAAAMFRAVRLGGGPCTGLSWRWGYGWPGC